MLNAEMILKKGIKPENLYIKTEIPNAFGDTPDVWDCVTEDVYHKLFQCKRMASLFKTEYSDGRCTYSDNTRCCCENISDHCRYYSGKSRKIIKKMFPITMPYIPKDHYVLWLTRLNQSQENYLVRHT